jgi:hypothetical protein
MQNDYDAFVVVSEEGRLDLDWQKLFLVFVQGKLIDDVSHHIETSYHKLFVYFKLTTTLSKHLVPLLTV